ncbi:unnamed protein product [Mesocestoides corti]|nr:unnamed protein product [Mesocestoides corti]
MASIVERYDTFASNPSKIYSPFPQSRSLDLLVHANGCHLCHSQLQYQLCQGRNEVAFRSEGVSVHHKGNSALSLPSATPPSRASRIC